MNDNLIEVKKLKPFTRFIYTIGELPSSYLMSMTYEEQLIWFCNYLSQTVIPSVNNNAEALIELQEYVKNYFDNLDVQEEINQKLDEMAEDGTLTTLISNYVDPEINRFETDVNNRINAFELNTNSRLDNFEESIENDVNSFKIDTQEDLANMNTLIQSLESGSPLVASSTSEMTDTTRIYVNTTNGYWYYYDGDSWEQGGVYQSTEDSTTVTDNETKIDSIYANDLLLVQGALVVTSGAFSASSTRLFTLNYLDGTHKIIMPDGFKIVGVLYYDGDDNYVSGNSINQQSATITPSNNYKYRITIAKTNGTDLITPIELDRTETMKHIYQNITKNMLQITNFEQGGFNSSGVEITASNRIRSDKIFGSHILYLPDGYVVHNRAYYNKSTDVFDSTHGVVNSDRQWFELQEKDGDYCRITISNSSATDITPLDIKYTVNNTVSPLSNKSILNFGDSIAAGDGNSGVGYAEIIANNNSMTCMDQAISGATMSNIGISYSRQCIYNIVHTFVTNSNDNYDFILLEGGCNDMQYNTQSLGTILPSYDVSSADISTFSGALEKSIGELKNKWPLANYIFVIVHKMTSRDLVLQKDYHDRSIEICNKWCIPYIDIYNDGQITSCITSIAETCFPANPSSSTGYDKTHPNETGYKKFYCPNIVSKMIDLISN